MLKSMNIEPFFDGYNVSQLDCINIPIAGAASCYNENNYYIYAFLYTIEILWGDNSLESTDYVLNKLGLISQPINNFNDKEEMIKAIKKSINESIPVVMYVTYNSLFYLKTEYLNELNSGTHAVVIFEYDDEKSIISIKEFVHNNNTLGKIMTSQPLFDITMKVDNFIEIWELSNEQFKLQNSEYYNNNLFAIEKYCPCLVSDFNSLFQFYLNTYKNKINNLAKILSDYNTYNNRYNALYIKRAFCNSLHIIFNVLEKFFYNNGIDENYLSFKDNYLNSRNRITNILIKNSIMERVIKEDVIKALIDEINDYDISLYQLIRDLFNKKNAINSVNLRKINNVIATADSEFNVFKAVNIISGNADNIERDLWASENTYVDHWLKLDLQKKYDVKKVTIRHYYQMLLRTVDFSIQVSDDDENWTTIETINDNSLEITEHIFSNCYCRYIRIYITKPAHDEGYARILAFDVWC